uniref:Uncharacterized protein n=1 Tax=Glossina austeni TaxID=7395 RepID=A0A1A9UVI2_GLOAU
MIIQNLTVFQLYEVKVAAGTTSIINPKKIILGKFSESRKIGLQPNCEKIQPLLRQSHNDYNLAVLVGIIFSCFGIVLIVMAFFLWRSLSIFESENGGRGADSGCYLIDLVYHRDTSYDRVSNL